jgi:hypothetical protein
VTPTTRTGRVFFAPSLRGVSVVDVFRSLSGEIIQGFSDEFDKIDNVAICRVVKRVAKRD